MSQPAENDATAGIAHRTYRTPLLRFACDRCGAGVGEECQTASGVAAQYQHAARYATEAAYYRGQEKPDAAKGGGIEIGTEKVDRW